MNHRGIWLTATVLAVVVLLAQVAGAATRDENASGATSASVSVTGTAWTDSLAEQASSVASEKSEAGLANANESIATRGRATTTTTTTTTNEVRANTPAGAPQDSTTGARPGWGCGDTNHTHSGPPGRPNATPPPNCKP
jgi:capsid protein